MTREIRFRNLLQGAIDDGHVDAQEKDNWFSEQQRPWPQQSLWNLSLDALCALRKLNPRLVDLPRRPCQSQGSLLQDDRAVRLRDEHHAYNQHCSSKHGHDSLQPPPSDLFTHKASHNWTKRRSKEGRCCKHRLEWVRTRCCGTRE